MKLIRNRMLFLLLCIASVAKAQTDSTTTASPQTTVRAGIFYVSRLHYYGRTDSLKSSAFFPHLEITFKDGTYLSGAPVFIYHGQTSPEYAGSIATLGYRYTKPGKYSWHLYALKPFYKSSSGLPQSALKAQGSAVYTHIFKPLQLSIGADFKYSDRLDGGALASLDKPVRFKTGEASVFVLDPTVTVNAGTQHFTQTKKQNGGIIPIPQTVTVDASRFVILSYEFSMPLVLVAGRWQLIANPAYVIPQNLMQTATVHESGASLFTVTVGARLKIGKE